MPIDQAELNIKTTASLGELEKATKEINDLKAATDKLGDTKAVRDIVSQLKDVAKEAKNTKTALQDISKGKVADTGALDASIKKVKELTAEVRVLEAATAKAAQKTDAISDNAFKYGKRTAQIIESTKAGQQTLLDHGKRMLEFNRQQEINIRSQRTQRARELVEARNLRNELTQFTRMSFQGGAGGGQYSLGNTRLSEMHRELTRYGLQGKDPFVDKKLGLKEFSNRVREFLNQISGAVRTLPDQIRKDAETALRQLGPGGSGGIQNIFRSNMKYAVASGFDTSGVSGVPAQYQFQKNDSGKTTGIWFEDQDKHRKMWQGSEKAFLQYYNSIMNAPKIPLEKIEPPKSTVGAWLNLKDSFAQFRASTFNLLKDIEQPFTSIAISFSRIAYGLRTIQMGLVQFGAGFSAVIGGATYAAKNFADSILEVTEVQKKAQITLEGVFGDKGLAQNITTFARQYAIETPATFREVTNMVKSFGFIPEIKKQILDVRGDAKALDKTLKDMAYTTIALGLTKPEQGIEGAVFSIREALAGQFRSLKLRFEMPMSAVAATVGMTEGQLKEDPKRIMEALKNFMDINVGEDTIKKLYRTFSTQLQNIADVFEKAKVAIGQSGFEQAMEQMAFNVASALEGMLNTNKFQQQLKGVSGLMTEFGRKMFGYGKAIAWALVGGDKQMTGAQIKPFTDQADKLAASGQFSSKQDYMDFVETQLLVATATDRISVAYKALLKILDSVIPRISSLLTSLVGDQNKINQLTDNLITFLNMLFSVADGMLKLIMGAVTFINNLPIGNVGKTLALFAMAFPVATFQTGFAAVNMLIKSIIMLGKITATNNLANVGASLVKLSSDLGVFLTNMTTGRSASNAMLASAGANSVAGFFMGGGKAVAAKNVGTQAGVYTSEGFMAAGAAGAGAARMGFMRGGAIAAAILGIGVFAEKITGINSIFSVTADLLGNVFVGALRIALTAINGWVDAVKMITSAVMGMYGWITEQVKGLNPFGPSTPKPQRTVQKINQDISSVLDAYSRNPNMYSKDSIDAHLDRLRTEREEAIKQGKTQIDAMKPAMGPLDHMQKVFEGLSWFSKDAGKSVNAILVPSIEELGKQAEGQAKLIESLAGKTNIADLFKNKSRSDFAGLSQYFSSTNIGDIVDSVDKFRLKDEFLNLQKLKSNYESFLKAPKGIAESQFTSFLDEKQFKFGVKGWREQYKKLMDEFDFSKHMEKAKEPLLFEQRNAGFKLMIQDAEKKADVVRQANDDIRQSQIRILELQDNGIQAKFKANSLELESKREELTLTQAIARATLDAAIAAETDAAKRQTLVDKMKELVNLQGQQTNLLNQEATLRDRATAVKEVGPVLKKFGMDASTMNKPEAFDQFADYINKSKALQDHMSKMETQNLKRSAEARESLKATITAEYEGALNLLTAAILAESGAIEKSFDSLYGSIIDGFSTLAFDVQVSVDNFAAQVESALNGMNIVLNVSAVVNAITNMVTGTVNNVATAAQTKGSLWNAIAQTGTAMYGAYKEAKAAKEEASRRMGPLGDPNAYKPGGGGGKGKKESLEERNRMLKEIADSEFVGDALRKTAFHGYTENEFKKKVEEIQKMQKDGTLKQAEAQQYLGAITAERQRKELEFLRKMESERAKELTQYTEVFRAAENNPLISNQAEMTQAKMALSALEMADAYKEIEFKAFKAKQSIEVMSAEILKQVGMTKEQAKGYVDMATAAENANYLLEMRKKNATGFEKGILNLPSDNEIFNKAQEDFVGQLSGGLSEALANAIDPDSNESLRESLSKLWKQLRRTVIKAFTDSIANNLVRGLFGGMMGGEQGGILGGGKVDAVAMASQQLTNAQGQTASSSWALNAAFGNLTGAAYAAAAAMQANAASSGFGGGGGVFDGMFGSFDTAFGAGASNIAESATGMGLGLTTIGMPIGGFFAEGGIVSKPTLSILGEGGEPEAIAPFSKLERMLNSRQKRESDSQPVSVNVVNVVDPQMVDKAIMANPNTVINVVASDMQNRGTTYQIMRGRR